MANKNIVQRFIKKLSGKSSESSRLLPMLYVNHDGAAKIALESGINYSLFRDFYFDSGLCYKKYELPNGRSVVCDRNDDNTLIICLHDNDGAIINLDQVKRNEFGSPESVIECDYLRHLVNNPSSDDITNQLSSHPVRLMIQKAIDNCEHQILSLPNDKVMIVEPPMKGELDSDVSVLLFNNDWRNLVKLYAHKDKLSTFDTPLRSLNDVAKYYDKVCDTRKPFHQQELTEKAIDLPIDRNAVQSDLDTLINSYKVINTSEGGNKPQNNKKYKELM